VLTKILLRRRAARFTGVLAALALTAGFAAAPATADPQPIYIGLGDSYAAGTGGGAYLPNSFPAPTDCRQTASAYSTQLHGFNWGCFGYTTEGVSAVVNGASLDPATAPYLANASVITVTVGGNDIDTGAVAANCVPSTATAGCRAALFNSLAVKLPKLPAKIKAMVALIKQKAPRAKVVLTGYPRLFTVSDLMPAEQKAAAKTMNSAADLLNATIALSALATRTKYVSVTNQFVNHGVGSASPWIVGLQPLCQLSATCPPGEQPLDTFHPTATGYTSGYRAAVAAALAP
jgi:lysophospholipase L1-like esterase